MRSAFPTASSAGGFLRTPLSKQGRGFAVACALDVAPRNITQRDGADDRFGHAAPWRLRGMIERLESEGVVGSNTDEPDRATAPPSQRVSIRLSGQSENDLVEQLI